MIAWQVCFAVATSIRRSKLECRKSISQNRLTFLATGSLAILHRLGATFTEAGVDLGEAACSHVVCQQHRGSEGCLLTSE